jgi:HEAT repeat protein
MPFGVATMAKLRGVEAKLARLRSIRKEPVSPAVIGELKTLLADPCNFVAAEAAAIIGDARLRDLTPDLVAAFDRFMIDPEDTDKLCRAKIAIVAALNNLEYDQPDVYLRGVGHVQERSTNPQPHDSAGPLRGDSALGLVRINYPNVVNLLVDLLFDDERVTRVACVQAVEGSGSVAAVPLLRFKALAGDKEPEVTCECFSALLKLDPESVAFVARFLHHGNEAIQEGAALALGETRRAGAFEVLRDFSARLRLGTLLEAVLLAIAMLRSPAAVDYLVELVARNDAACAALSALAIHRHTDKIRERVAAAVAQTNNPSLQARFEEKFRK